MAWTAEKVRALRESNPSETAKDKSSLTIGDFVNVKITDVLENNLLGERV